MILSLRFASIYFVSALCPSPSKVYWTESKAGGELENPIDSKSNWNRKGAVVLYRERGGQTLSTLIEGRGRKGHREKKRRKGSEEQRRAWRDNGGVGRKKWTGLPGGFFHPLSSINIFTFILH
jgi:hypothetical protein